MDKAKVFDAIEANKAQITYCDERRTPHFAPTKYCGECRQDIYGPGGIDVERAGSHHITGCPFCNRSYCD